MKRKTGRGIGAGKIMDTRLSYLHAGMIVYCILAITIVIALLSLRLLWRALQKGAQGWPALLLAVTIAAFIYLYGAWVFLSVYTKYVFALCFVVTAVAGLLRTRKKAVSQARSFGVLAVLFSLVFAVLSVLYFTGTTGKPYRVINLALPFRGGRYLVFQGGKGLPTNLFHYKLRTAVFAMDIVKLNDAGNRASSIFSTRLEDYSSFGDTVYSPCSGRIVRTKDTNKDNEPPHVDRGTGNINMALIETDSAYVFLGHFKQGSVMVKEGDTVRTGQPLALAGNSGFSLEPHLHIQAHAKTNPAIPWYKEKPLQIAFDGKTYLLFEEITAPAR